MKRELLEKIIELTLEQVREKGLELLDENTATQNKIVADAIEDEVNDFIEDINFEEEWEKAIDEIRNPGVIDDEEDDDMIVLDDGPLNPITFNYD
jgi:hypothetical protein